MMYCYDCYKKAGLPFKNGMSWEWGRRKRNKWGKNLREYTTCAKCGTAGTDLYTNYNPGWKEVPKRKFYGKMELKTDPAWEKKQKEKQQQQTLAQKILAYRRKNAQ